MGSAREVVERGIRAFNAKDEATLLDISAPDFVLTSTGGMSFNGAQAALEFDRNWWGAFPDCSTELIGLHVDGETVIENGIFKGTHTGTLNTPMGPIEATGKKIAGHYIGVYTIRGDKVAKQDLLFDRMDLMEQLGLMPTAAAAGAAS